MRCAVWSGLVRAETTGGAVGTGSWVLDGSRTEIRLKSKSIWGSGGVTGTVTVAARSVDTRHKQRDNHLRSADFFDVDGYPAITFTVNEVTAAETGLTVAGQLTVRDRTRPVSFEMSVSGFDGNEAHLDGELRVNRADFGLTWNRLGAASMNNTIIVHAVFTRQ
jgi:polyisoprenoid-binding protein YceI